MASSGDSGFMLKETLLAQLRAQRWRPGQRLPTERALCAQYVVSRSAVRRALGEMKELGLITQTVGSGTYVSEGAAERLAGVAGRADGVSPAELMEARIVFEPSLVDLIVRHGTPADFAELETICRRADGAQTLEQFEHWDAAFHGKLAAATHNGFVVDVFALIARVRDQGEWGLLKRNSATIERRAAYQREHWALQAALRVRDADAARALLTDHLLGVRRNMFGH